MNNLTRFERNSFDPTFEQEVRERNPNFNFEISDDFIGVFDGCFSTDYCADLVEYYKKLDREGLAYYRSQHFDPALKPLTKDDRAIDFNNYSFSLHNGTYFSSKEFNELFWFVCYRLYVEKFQILKNISQHSIDVIKIQKTEPMQGYHMWHCEAGNAEVARRILVFTLYLNDVEVGGETEFLYQKRRISPKAGRLVIWPAAFTHAHRGNPPLSGPKYILTGWVNL